MKKFVAVLSLLALAGCAGNDKGFSFDVIEDPLYLRAERKLEQDFVQIQRSVFEHQAACNPEVQFSRDDLYPSNARVTKPFRPGATNSSEMVVLSLARMTSGLTRARVYSYYATTNNQVQEMFDIVLNPEKCAGAE
ncbi:MAG: CRISPR-associated endonuclease Cas2 [Pusillimonas sp.]|nr:CRISPR-associated endonuclease Cas2 [Pusillimonas sp.]